MSGSFQLNDDASGLVGTLSGEDKGGNPEPLPAGSTANWTLNDPDGTITMTISTDTLSVQLVPTGKITVTQDAQLGVSVNIPAQPQPLTGSVAIHVNAGALASVSISLAPIAPASPATSSTNP